MRKLSIGLIGYGIWGRKILQELIVLCSEVHVFDPLIKESSGILQPDATTFDTDFDTFMEHPLDGIIIASATSSHHELLAMLKPYDLPVFIEKPLTNSRERLKKIQQLDLKNIYVMHIWKYHPGVQLLAHLAQSGKLGVVKGARSIRANWTSPRKDTDSLWNLAIHDLSICESILGAIPKRKQVVCERHNGVIRGLTALMGAEPYYQFEVSNRYPHKVREIVVFGTEAVAILQDEQVDYVTVYHGDDQSELTSKTSEKMYFDNTPPLRIELLAFLNYLEGGAPPFTDLEEGNRLIDHLAEIESACQKNL